MWMLLLVEDETFELMAPNRFTTWRRIHVDNYEERPPPLSTYASMEL
jgi:hypothetical protein